MNKTKLWTKDFLIDSIVNLFIYLVYYLLMITMTEYAKDNLSASPSEAGLASGIFIIGALVARIFSGRAIDVVGRKKMLYFGLCFFLCTTLLYFIVNNLIILFIIRFLHGVGFGISGTATGTIVANIIPNERRGEGTSYYAMSTTFASAIGPSLAIFINSYGNFNLILFLAVTLLVLCFAIVFFLNVPETQLTKEQVMQRKELKLSNFFEAKAIPISIVIFFVGLAFSSVLSFLNSYTREINLVYAGSFFFIVYASSILLSRPVTGILFDRKGQNYLMYPSFLLLAAGLAILSKSSTGFGLLSAGVLVGLGYGTLVSCGQAIANKVSEKHRMGLATSTFFSFLDGGVGIGPFLLGFIIPVTGLRGIYINMSLVAFGCIFLYYFLQGKKNTSAKCNSLSTSEN